jgi:ribosomal protein S18 acetylase RimI-like enzyme
MFNLQPELAAKVTGHQHWFNVDDIDELYTTHKRLGAPIVSELQDQPWGMREYVVVDPTGYHLRFAGPISGPAAGSSPFPEGTQITREIPTQADYLAVAGAAFGYRESAEILKSTWGGIVARSRDGEAIGLLRVMYDAPGWYSIWDVAVLPDWQGRHVGSRMMKEALSMIHDAAPGSNVFLFTFKHGFYERLGFAQQSVSLKRV